LLKDGQPLLTLMCRYAAAALLVPVRSYARKTIKGQDQMTQGAAM